MKRVAIQLVHPGPIAMRYVDRSQSSYKRLFNEIRDYGQEMPIAVRVVEDKYEIIDGLHRYQVLLDLDFEFINVEVIDISDDRVLEYQIMVTHKYLPTASEYKNQLKRILLRNPEITLDKLAQKLGRNRLWIKSKLGLDQIKNAKIKPKPKAAPINPTPLQRSGWDAVHGHGSAKFAYCRGDVLVLYTGRHWTINHPEIPKLSSLSFGNTTEAMTFVEKWFDK